MDSNSLTLKASLFAILVVTSQVRVSAEDSPSDWQPLFNGQNLDGWLPVVRNLDQLSVELFRVDDGAIHVYWNQKSGKAVPLGFLATKDKYSWYHLTLQFQWGKNRFRPRAREKRDSGVLFHAGPENKVWPRCIECQIQEGDTGDCFTVYGAGVQTTVDPAKLKKGTHLFLSESDGGVTTFCGGPHISRVIKGADQEIDGWNTVEVIVRGHEEAIYKVNGHQVFRAVDLKQLASDGETWIPLSSGRILLQAEYAEVLYRNIQIKPFDGKPFRVADSTPGS